MKYVTLLITFLFPLVAMSQEKFHLIESYSIRDTAHSYRRQITIPPYGLEKVKQLIANAWKSRGDGEDSIMLFFDVQLNEENYNALSLREKFTYNMINAEWYNQNCSLRPSITGNEKEIAGNLPDAFSLCVWSTRQDDFLKNNRDSVIYLIRETANNSKRIGLNYKHAIVEIRALEMVPFVVEFYNRDHKDRDLLTVLLLLMRDMKYAPFTSSTVYTKLYGPESRYGSVVEYSKSNEKLIIKHAMDLYNSMN